MSSSLKICTIMPLQKRAAVDTTRMWQSGKTIRVGFIEGSPALVSRIIPVADIWCQYANIKFEYIKQWQRADIRIAFRQGQGSWSYVGTDCLSVPMDEPTMNFGWFDESTPKMELQRTTLHEFGHALGLIHEHQNPAGGIPWDKEKVYEWYWNRVGWSKEIVDANVLDMYDSDITSHSSQVDPKSIMMYPIPSELTTNGYCTEINSSLSPTDIEFIRQTYPGETRQHSMPQNGASSLFVKQVHEVARQIHANAIDKGWWEEPRSDGDLIALCHSELSEAFEAIRNHNPMSQKITDFTALEEELADTIIRILDWSSGKHMKIPEAIIAKMNYNRHREYKHGGKAL